MVLNKFCRVALALPLLILALIGTPFLPVTPTKAESSQPREINQNPLTVGEVRLEPVQPDQMQDQRLFIEIQLAQSHHAYLDQFRLTIDGLPSFRLGPIEVDPVTEFYDRFSKKNRIGVKDKAVVTALLHIPEGAGQGVLPLQLTYQACTEDYCLFPKTVPVTVDMTGSRLATRPAPNDKITEVGGSDWLSQAQSQSGWLWVFLLVFLGGILTSFTPCIYPMIPITLAILGTREGSTSSRSGFLLSVSYVTGIAITYSVMGVVAAMTGALFGALLGHPIVVSLIALVFVAMALSMSGLFEVRLPHALTQKLTTVKMHRGHLGAFVMGLFAGLVASPCVGPVLVSILAFVARTQNAGLGFALLFVYAIGMGQIFLVLGTFSQLTQKLPQSGPWMDRIKWFFSAVMLAMALYYLAPIVSPATLFGLAASFILGFGALLLWRLSPEMRRPPSESEYRQVRWRRRMLFLLIGFSSGVCLMIAGHPDVAEQLLRPGAHLTTQARPQPNWQRYTPELHKKALASGTPVILDFKADWCAACHELEEKTFSDSRVREFGKDFVWLTFDATKSSPELEALKKEFNIIGLPAVQFFDAQGKWRADLTLTGFEGPQEFLDRLRKL